MSVGVVSGTGRSRVAQRRQRMADLVEVSGGELRRIIGSVSEETRENVRDYYLFLAVTELVALYGRAASQTAVEDYMEDRWLNGIESPFRPGQEGPPAPEQIRSLLRWAKKSGLGEQDPATYVKKIVAGVGLIIWNQYRNTIVGNSNMDSDAFGWRRYGQGATCNFCLMLIDRGAVYTEETAVFKAHTNCNCSAGPAWNPFRKVKPEVFQYSQRRHLLDDGTYAPVDNEGVYTYLEDNYGSRY